MRVHALKSIAGFHSRDQQQCFSTKTKGSVCIIIELNSRRIWSGQQHGRLFATLWRDKLHETFHSVTYPATAKIVARQVARAVAESRINLKFYFSCNLSCNDFGPCRVYYTVTCSEQLVPPQCRENIARQVARKISQCNSAFKLVHVACMIRCVFTLQF